MDYSFLTTTKLFSGISEQEVKHVLSCLQARQKSYRKNEIIYSAGSTVEEIGLVLSGSVNILVNFYWGNSQILGHIEKGDIFAENYASIPNEDLICDVVATEASDILFLNLKNLLNTCISGCQFHQRLIFNLFAISAQKSLQLSSRMLHTAPRTIRDRLLSYLSEQAIINSSNHFKIPFNRQQLADYLGVDRSALSKELSNMQKSGLIKFKKNDFILNDIDFTNY